MMPSSAQRPRLPIPSSAQLARVHVAGGRMLSGGIVGYPRHIGGAETLILYAGDGGEDIAALFKRMATRPDD